MNNTKIIITGATSGIGLEIKKQLSNSNEVINISRKNGFDLSEPNGIESALQKIINENPKFLFLNSGIAKFGDFSENSLEDIQKLISVNLNSNIYLISKLKKQIKDGLKIIATLSTASYINGAYEALYNSSKKALKEFIISVNTELKDQNIDGRIFLFVPHKIDGTKMTSENNTPNKKLESIVSELLKSIDEGKDLFIPSYDEVYKCVFDEYTKNPYKQGEESIAYKRGKHE